MRVRPCTVGGLTVVSMLLLAPSSIAQTPAQLSATLAKLAGTIRVYFQPMVSRGSLIGCTLVFDTLHQDHAYSQGRFIKASGSVGILGMEGTLGASVKVVVSDVDPASMSQTPASPAPTRAYLVAGDYTTNLQSLVQTYPSDTPGALFSVFQAEPTFQIVMAALQSRTINIAFNRGEGDTDILLPVEIDVLDVNANGLRQRSEKASDEFTDCLDALLKTLHPQ